MDVSSASRAISAVAELLVKNENLKVEICIVIILWRHVVLRSVDLSPAMDNACSLLSML